VDVLQVATIPAGAVQSVLVQQLVLGMQVDPHILDVPAQTGALQT
jgi:hypothetical protein